MTRKRADWLDMPIPVVIPLTHLRLAGERGVDPVRVLERAGLPVNFIAHPFELRIFQMHTLMDAMLHLTGDDGLGLDTGWRLPPTAFGNFGYALLCSETIRDALLLCQKYWHLVARGTLLHVNQQDGRYIAEIRPVVSLPSVHHRLVMETTFSSVYRGFQLLVADAVDSLEVWFDFPAPVHAAKMQAMLRHVRFDMPACQLRFPAEILDIQLTMHNPTALKFAVEQCERENALADLEIHEILTRVRNKVVFTGKGYPTLETVSQQLNMTTRTLRRRLVEEGTTFKALVEEAKRRDAVRLLDDHAIPVQKIAELLGYHDPANFTRAFRQWTDQTPSQYRLTRGSRA